MMKKIFFDTNVIIDVMVAREPFFTNSMAVLSLCETGKAEGIVSTLTFCNVSYILRKLTAPADLRSNLLLFRKLLTPVDLSASLVDKAIASSISDFKDAIQYYSAQYGKADFIITRNVRHFPKTPIPVLTPTEYLAITT